MKIHSLLLLLISISGCGSQKESTTTNSASSPTTNSSGVFAPRPQELAAIQIKYFETTMETLQKGYSIYTGVCTNCHGAQSIYSHSSESWIGIIDDMAARAKISNSEKDAVYKYVMSIKATQPADLKGLNQR